MAQPSVDRLTSHTKASSEAAKAALSEREVLAEGQGRIKRFSVHGYTEEQIGKDPRLRVEAALRQAGLQDTDYARRVLSQVPPPQPPRPEMRSSVFRSDGKPR